MQQSMPAGFVFRLLHQKLINLLILMDLTKGLIIGHSIFRRFNRFLNDDEDVRFDASIGLAATHKVYLKGTGGRKIEGILREDAHFIRRIKPDHLTVFTKTQIKNMPIGHVLV